MKSVFILAVCCCLFACLHVYGQDPVSAITTQEVIIKEGDFEITFPDSITVITIHVKSTYTSKEAKYKIEMYKDKDDDEITASFTIDKVLNFSVFESKFNETGKSNFKFLQAAKEIDVYKIYNMVWSIKHAMEDAVEAGVLQFSKEIMVFNNDNPEKKGNSNMSGNLVTSFDTSIINNNISYRNSYIRRKNWVERFHNKDVDIRVKLAEINEKIKESNAYKESLNRDLKRIGDSAYLSKEDKPDKYDSSNYVRRATAYMIAAINYFSDNANRDSLRFRDTSNTIDNYLQMGRIRTDSLIKFLTDQRRNIFLNNKIDSQSYRTLNRLANVFVKEPKSKVDSLIKSRNIKDYYRFTKDSMTAIVKMQNDVLKELKENQNSDIKEVKVCKISKVEMQFEKGFLEHVKVWVAIDNAEYIFENIFAIGFSSVNNYQKLSDTRLYVRNSSAGNNLFIYLSDILRNYDNRLHNYTRDYSPADTSFRIDPSSMHEIILRKETYVNLLDAKLYTDLKGINQNNPNGLFQVELSKRFNINTNRSQIGTTRSDYGFFNYLELYGGVNKIEENNKQLRLSNNYVFNNGVLSKPNYATNLNFLRYENYSLGFNVGLLLFDKPDQKYTVYLDFGIKYGHVSIDDSINTPVGPKRLFNSRLEAHTLTFQFPKLCIELFPESRITPKFSWHLNSTRLFSNNQFKQVVSYEKSDPNSFLLEKNARLSNQYEVYLRIAPTRDRTSHMFLRWRFFTQYSDANTSFSQFQVGYTFNWTAVR